MLKERNPLLREVGRQTKRTLRGEAGRVDRA